MTILTPFDHWQSLLWNFLTSYSRPRDIELIYVELREATTHNLTPYTLCLKSANYPLTMTCNKKKSHYTTGSLEALTLLCIKYFQKQWRRHPRLPVRVVLIMALSFSRWGKQRGVKWLWKVTKCPLSEETWQFHLEH